MDPAPRPALPPTPDSDLKLRGLDVSPGIAIGPAFVLDAPPTEPKETVIPPGQVEREVEDFRGAVQQAVESLKAQALELEATVGPREAQILRTHVFFLQDKDPKLGLVPLIERIIVEERVDARTAIRKAAGRLSEHFAALENPLLRERDVDLRDVADRLVAQLARRLQGEPARAGHPVVIVARELFPTHAALLRKDQTLGIVTEFGGKTSHAAIIAKSLGIPAVSGIDDAARRIASGITLAVDGGRGEVILNPARTTLRDYGELSREYGELRRRERLALPLPTETADGRRILLFANVDRLEDTDPEVLRASDGIGLFRTEYFFMAQSSFPSEEDQYRHYLEVIERVGRRKEVVLRTLDIGGDKMLSYFGIPHEENPFLGLRSIRLSFQHPDVFRAQLRAMLRASAHGKVKLLFPMITTLKELRDAKSLLDGAREELRQEGRAFDPQLRVGFLVEVPAAALTLRHLLPECDFVNVGTNDLIQYLMAVDRTNPKIAYLYEPLNPAVLALLRQLIADVRRGRKEVTVCGEMGGNAHYTVLLLGMGFRRFSVSAYAFPAFKEMVRRVRMGKAREVAKKALSLASADEVADYLKSEVERLGGAAGGRLHAPAEG
jgi:phosphotransferase system enzyme I (PtsI)